MKLTYNLFRLSTSMSFTRLLLKTAMFNLAVLLLLSIGCSHDPNKTTTLKVSGVTASDQIALLVYDTTGVIKSGADKKVEDEYQLFKFKANQPLVYIIEAGNESFELIIQPGEDVEITVEPTHPLSPHLLSSSSSSSIFIHSSSLKQENQNHQDYLRQLHPLEIQADSLSHLFIAAQSTDSFALVRERVTEQYESLVDQAKSISIDYIKNYGTSIAIFSALNRAIRKLPVFNYTADWKYVLMTDSLLRTHNPEHPYTRWLSNQIKITIGNPAIETGRIKPGTFLQKITLPALNGKSVTIQPAGKGISLIHLWNSSPSGREMNKLVKLIHEKYNSNDFNLYSICFDTNLKQCSAAVTVDKMWWNNLIDISADRSSLLTQLNQPKLPSIIVVDNEMKVLGYFTSAQILEEWIDQYFTSDTTKKQLN